MTSHASPFLLPGLRALAAALARANPEPAESRHPPRDVQAFEPLRQRDPNAWNQLFTNEMPAVFRYVRARVGGTHEAEDLTSIVFEEAWKHADRLEDRGLPARAWLIGIARHVVATHHRRWFRSPPHLTLEAFDQPHQETGLSAELLDLANAVRHLSRSHAEVITLRFIHGLSLQETAEVLRISLDGVKGRQARALLALRERLDQQA